MQDVMIVDVGQVIVWFGKYSNVPEQLIGLQTAIEYAGERECLVTKQNQEPLSCTSHFHGWSNTSEVGIQVKDDHL